MANKDLRLLPKRSRNGNWWWYEESEGIRVYCLLSEDKISSHLIRWQSIRNALKRKNKK